MNVSLTPQLEEFVRRKVETGLYTSASEVVREALRLLESKERTEREKLEALRRDIQEGIDSGFEDLNMQEIIQEAHRLRKEGRL
ncbi:type II toxin-antitoxin system ParD family antitoxin [Aerophototrophica crusticola]|uniref:Type II toxin-antitoxin system ParD family antitoxin n=1 Tax=Aerophototrophica crusticola TaxID=1709002 RepID=A0A858RC06_9PROT|nr:type II toxin-antitoxin system ParD family antitoxin [Rhodospirillaceae bacterium B3]